VTVRPGPLESGAPHVDRIARLERYVERVDEDVSGLWNEIGSRAEEAFANAKREDAELRKEMETRDAERRTALRSSMRRQAWGAVFVLLGLALGTLGNLL
jgi:hypothetical protein